MLAPEIKAEDGGAWVNSEWLCLERDMRYAGKTERWIVRPRDVGPPLGVIKWFGRWRCYSFFPQPDTVYEHKCLRDIAEFCEAKTKEHRSGARA